MHLFWVLWLDEWEVWNPILPKLPYLVSPIAYSPPTLTSVGHQWTVSTNTSCNQWFSLTKSILKVAHVGRNRSLVANTSKCGCAISYTSHACIVPSHVTLSLWPFWCTPFTYPNKVIIVVWRMKTTMPTDVTRSDYLDSFSSLEGLSQGHVTMFTLLWCDLIIFTCVRFVSLLETCDRWGTCLPRHCWLSW